MRTYRIYVVEHIIWTIVWLIFAVVLIDSTLDYPTEDTTWISWIMCMGVGIISIVIAVYNIIWILSFILDLHEGTKTSSMRYIGMKASRSMSSKYKNSNLTGYKDKDWLYGEFIFSGNANNSCKHREKCKIVLTGVLKAGDLRKYAVAGSRRVEVTYFRHSRLIKEIK